MNDVTANQLAPEPKDNLRADAMDSDRPEDREVLARSSIGPLMRQDRYFLRYLVAAVVVLGIGGLRWALVPILGTQAPLLPFLLAVLVAAGVAGRGPGLLASGFTPLVGTMLFTHPPYGPHAFAWSAHVALFTLIGVSVTLLIHRLQQSYRAQHAALLVTQAAEKAAREAERQANASAAQLRLITDAMPALIAYVDPQYRYQFTNRRYEDWFGIPSNSSLGRHVRDVLGELAYVSLLPHMAEALSGHRVRVEAQMPQGEGEIRQVEAHYIPDLGPENEVKGYFALVTDITERKQTERRLREQQQMLELIYDHSSDGLYLIHIESDEHYRFVSVNETFLNMTGYERAHTEGSLLEEILPAANQPLLRGKILEAITSGGPVVYTETTDVPAGRRYGEVTLIPIPSSEGAFTHVLGAIKDVTANKQAEQALLAADRRKDEFLAMLAHELRNPLAPIRNVAHLLAMGPTDAAQLRRNSEILDRQARHLTRLVDDLLDVARITRGAIELEKAPIGLQGIIDSALESVQPLFDVKRQTVTGSRADMALRVEGDAVRLTQVFANLLGNAAKFSPDRALIEVSVEQWDEQAVVRVRDEGAGIDAQVLPHIFELFMQADRSLDRSQGGLGIGLTIANSLVQMHGGRMEAHSAGIGQGSEFVVRLPLIARADGVPPALGFDLRNPTQRCRILVVDDNDDAAESLAMLLSSAGHEVRTAHDGEAAVSLLHNFPAEVVFLDIGLPGADGYVVAQSIRERFPNFNRRLYALTGYGREEDRALALSAGFDDHFTKPVDPERLLQLILAPSRSDVPTRTGRND
jgi:PAS domain S-box-containing protein